MRSDDYPTGLSDERLLAQIQEYADIATGGTHLTAGFQVRQDQWQLALLGQSEYSNRIQKRFADETRELKNEITSLKKSNNNYSRKSMRLSLVTISLAIVTIFLAATTIWYSKRDMESDRTWRNDQMTELKKQNELLQEQIRVESERYMELYALILKNNESNKEN